MPGKKNAEQPERRTGDAVRRRLDDGAEISGEGEERPRNRLRRAVAGQKRIVADPAGRDERLAQQRQHDMAATEDQRAGAVESVEQRDARRALQRLCKIGSPTSKTKNAASADQPDAARDRHGDVALRRRRRAAAKP